MTSETHRTPSAASAVQSRTRQAKGKCSFAWKTCTLHRLPRIPQLISQFLDMHQFLGKIETHVWFKYSNEISFLSLTGTKETDLDTHEKATLLFGVNSLLSALVQRKKWTAGPHKATVRSYHSGSQGAQSDSFQNYPQNGCWYALTFWTHASSGGSFRFPQTRQVLGQINDPGFPTSYSWPSCSWQLLLFSGDQCLQ